MGLFNHMKTCAKCREQKPLSEYYRHPKTADGHLHKCKGCHKKAMHDRRHGDGRSKVLAYDALRSKTDARMAKNRSTSRQWRDNHPLERAAQAALAYAIRVGAVVKWPACAVPECNSCRPVAHHPDYSRPLDVVWLCQAHHKQAHALASNT